MSRVISLSISLKTLLHRNILRRRCNHSDLWYSILYPMNRLSRIDTLPKSYQGGEVFRHALATRAMLERVWDETTAFQGITLRPDDVPSRDQCGVSTLWLARHLLDQGVETRFVEGKIHLLSGNGDDHVWVEARLNDTPTVIDLTSDQYQSILGTSVHMGQYGSEADTIGRYTPEQYLDPYDVPRRKLMARYALLEQKIAMLPRRHRLRVK